MVILTIYSAVLATKRSRKARSRESGATASRSQENELEKRREILDVRERPDAEFCFEVQVFKIRSSDDWTCKIDQCHQPRSQVRNVHSEAYGHVITRVCIVCICIYM